MRRPWLSILMVMWVMTAATTVMAAQISDIRNTKHNFSATVVPSAVTRTASASSESQICAFCHTPHGATKAPKTPLWNRKLSSATYIPFSSTSLDATDLSQPGGKSKLCLSCHDGTIALGSVNVLNRIENQTVPFTGTEADGTIPAGPVGVNTGFTRRLGVDLTNDHPISFTFDSAQAARDGELYTPGPGAPVHERTRVSSPATADPALPQGDYLPLEDDKVECISCHDPHVRSDVPGENNKFLRVNRFQQATPVDGQFSKDDDIICLGCHDKNGWVGSAHADPAAANERYSTPAADLREFPAGLQVWQAACLNCHDPHTVQGSRRILREGTDGPVATTALGARYKQGGNPAVEEVCWACHSADGNVLLGQNSGPSTNPSFEVPDIKTDFTTMARHMPIQSADQAAGMEIHSIGTGDAFQGDTRGQDFIEAPQNLGKGNLNNRHAECTDCHNPHRVMKNRLFNGTSGDTDAGTHEHKDGVPHTNIASGVLRGIWGVEPVYGSTEFGAEPVSFEVKRGDPGSNPSTAVTEPFLTREYQVCFKCHSNYTYNQPPLLGSFSGGTPPGTNSMTQYTNQAMEYQSPDGHKGEGTSATPSGAFAGLAQPGYNVDYQTNNHRAWHPIVKETGRTPLVRGMTDGNDWRSPFNAAVGTQTMYCSDCHGSKTADATTVVPDNGENGYPWGPHGSNSNFLLKGDWDNVSGNGKQTHLCFRCHDYNQYGRALAPPYNDPGPPNQIRASGFQTKNVTPIFNAANAKNLHTGHSSFLINGGFSFRCTFCHVAVPHGWKNKVFLANLNDVGLEAPILPADGTPNGAGSRQVKNNTTARYYNGPYYNGSVLKVNTFATSGNWVAGNCGSSGAPGNAQTGVNWMSTSNEACMLPP